MTERVIEKIGSKQPKTRSTVWMVGEQLKDMVRAEPSIAEIIDRDLDIPEMSLEKCESEIKQFARKHGNCAAPLEAEKIIREFYGLPEKKEKKTAAPSKLIDLAEFF